MLHCADELEEGEQGKSLKLDFCCVSGGREEEGSRVCVDNDRKTNLISGILRVTGLESLGRSSHPSVGF